MVEWSCSHAQAGSRAVRPDNDLRGAPVGEADNGAGVVQYLANSLLIHVVFALEEACVQVLFHRQVQEGVNDAFTLLSGDFADCLALQPLVFLQDVTGFMVGSRSEQGGIIKDGAKLVNAMSNSIVPKFTIITGNSYGAGNYAMCGKAYDPRLIVGWPTATLAVMGGDQAAKVLLQIQVATLKSKGEKITEKAREELLKKITDRYNEQASPYYAAARLWLDAIIDPADTRKWISMGIEMADHNPIRSSYSVGVIQT